MFSETQIVVVGCGAIGLPLAVALASRGAEVVGVDSDEARLAQLTAGAVDEGDSGLGEALRLALAQKRIRFQSVLRPRPLCRAFILAVPTPVDDQLRPNRSLLDTAFAQVLAVARSGDLVIVRSTVAAGTTRTLAAAAAGRGQGLLFAACPDRSLTGRAFADQLSIPNIVGPMSAEAGRMAAAILARLGAVHVLDSPEAAELVKLFCNAQRDVTFALANQFALICDTLDVNFQAVAETAADHYPRFNVAVPGPVGGPCLSKDSYLLAESVDWREDLAGLVLAAREVNASLPQRIVEKIAAHARSVSRPTPGVAILGLAFKGEPPTRDQRGSFGLQLADAIRFNMPEAIIRQWDPEIPHVEPSNSSQHVSGRGKTEKGPHSKAATFSAAVDGADIVVLANNHQAIRSLDWQALSRRMQAGGLIIDTYGYPGALPQGLPNDVTFVKFGSGERYGRADASRSEAAAG